jgi:hypothetical protein
MMHRWPGGQVVWITFGLRDEYDLRTLSRSSCVQRFRVFYRSELSGQDEVLGALVEQNRVSSEKRKVSMEKLCEISKFQFCYV